jgi:hypothetical protein
VPLACPPRRGPTYAATTGRAGSRAPRRWRSGSRAPRHWREDIKGEDRQARALFRRGHDAAASSPYPAEGACAYATAASSLDSVEGAYAAIASSTDLAEGASTAAALLGPRVPSPPPTALLVPRTACPGPPPVRERGRGALPTTREGGRRPVTREGEKESGWRGAGCG